MNVKISTNRIFHAITIQEAELAANMTEELQEQLRIFLKKDVKNLVVIMKDIQKIDSAAARELLDIRNRFYDNRASFVLCEPQPAVKKILDQVEQFSAVLIAPSLSEASDLVHLEEMEREMTD